MRHRILIVDDSQDDVILIRRKLTMAAKLYSVDLDVRDARDLETALEELVRHPRPHVVLSDINLTQSGRREGFTVKKAAAGLNIPCFVMSGTEPLSKDQRDYILPKNGDALGNWLMSMIYGWSTPLGESGEKPPPPR